MKRLSFVLIAALFLSCNLDEKQFRTAEKENSIDAYRKFLQHNPKSKFASEAKNRIGDLMYRTATDLNTEQAYLDFIQACPTSEHLQRAARKAAELGWHNIADKDSEKVFTDYIARYPNSPFISKAKSKLEDLLFVKSDRANSYTATKAFLDSFPDGKWSVQARQKLARLERLENSWQSFSTGQNGTYLFKNSTATSALSYDAELEIVISDGKVHLAFEALLVTENGSQFHFHKDDWAYTGQLQGSRITARSDNGAGITSFELKDRKVYGPMLGSSEIVPYSIL